jgi:hypothetical protein
MGRKKKVPVVWIEMRYKDEPDNWVDVSEEDCLEKLEWNGYYKKGTVAIMLRNGKVVETPYSEYRMKKENV